MFQLAFPKRETHANEHGAILELHTSTTLSPMPTQPTTIRWTQLIEYTVMYSTLLYSTLLYYNTT